MNITAAKKIVSGTVFLILMSACSLSWAWDLRHHSARKLKAADADVKGQTVVLESPDGDTAVLTVGDEAGEEKAVVTKIMESGAVLETAPDSAGNTEEIFIPADIIRSAEPVSPEKFSESPGIEPVPAE